MPRVATKSAKLTVSYKFPDGTIIVYSCGTELAVEQTEEQDSILAAKVLNETMDDMQEATKANSLVKFLVAKTKTQIKKDIKVQQSMKELRAQKD